MWTCNRLDLETLGYQPVVPKITGHSMSDFTDNSTRATKLASKNSLLKHHVQIWLKAPETYYKEWPNDYNLDVSTSV